MPGCGADLDKKWFHRILQQREKGTFLHHMVLQPPTPNDELTLLIIGQ